MNDITIMVDGKPVTTPQKKPLAVPTQALADAIANEWKTIKRPSECSLTLLAYTAIDQIGDNTASIIEVVLAYVETDALCYRAHSQGRLLLLQQQQWDPVLAWAKTVFGDTWQTTQGVMPIDQSPALHSALRTELERLSAMQLSALSVLTSLCSSLALAFAILKQHLNAEQVFKLSRLEEDTQAEQWGVDEEAASRAEKIKAEIVSATRFLRLLEAV